MMNKQKHNFKLASLALALAFSGGNAFAAADNTFSSGTGDGAGTVSHHFAETGVFSSVSTNAVDDAVAASTTATITTPAGNSFLLATADSDITTAHHFGYNLNTNTLNVAANSVLTLRGQRTPLICPPSVSATCYVKAFLRISAGTGSVNLGLIKIDSYGTLVTKNASVTMTNGASAEVRVLERGSLEVTHAGNFINNGKINFEANSYFQAGTSPNDTGVITNNKDIFVNLPNQIVHNTPPAQTLDTLTARVDMATTASRFVIVSNANETLPPLTFPTPAAPPAPPANITIGGGAGNISLDTINTGGANLNIIGPVSVPAAPSPAIIAPNVDVTGSINIGAGGSLDVTGSVVVQPGTSINVATCPAVGGSLIVASGGVTGAKPSVTCPGFTGTTEIVAGDLVVKAMNPNPVIPVPVNAPLGLGLTALALAFLGRKRIQKALGA